MRALPGHCCPEPLHRDSHGGELSDRRVQYAATHIDVGMGEVKRVAFNFPPITNVDAAVQYTQDLTGCVLDRTKHPPPCVDFEGTSEATFQNGRFEDDTGNRGSLFIPTPPAASGTRGFDINALLNIHWCPNENYFQVTVAGQGPYILPSQYFLADGGKSCSTACANKASTCNLRAITSAASSVARCRDVVSSLGMSFKKSGMYTDDDSGCTFHPVGPRGPVSGNGRTWPKPNGSGRREICATGSGKRV